VRSPAGRSIICAMARSVAFLDTTRKRGNPNWGVPIPPAPALATEFVMQVRQLRLTEEMYVFSAELHGWCGRTESGPHPRMAT
jgi:hypothetical protein